MAAMGVGNPPGMAEHEVASLLLAGLATPLVLSVHSVVSFDFAVGIVPGWHATIFPPYFVAGAIYPASPWCSLHPAAAAALRPHDFIPSATCRTWARCSSPPASSSPTANGIEAFTAWYSANQYETFMMWNVWSGRTASTTTTCVSCKHRGAAGALVPLGEGVAGAGCGCLHVQ